MPLAVTRTPSVGSPVTYDAADTNAARGTALLLALSESGNGDTLALAQMATYNIAASVLDLSLGGTGTVHMTGADQFLTIITSTAALTSVGPIVRPGATTTVSNLKIVGSLVDATYQACFGVRSINDATSTAATLTNVAMQCGADGIYYLAGTSGHAYSLTANNVYGRTTFDVVVFFAEDPGDAGTVNATFNDCDFSADGSHPDSSSNARAVVVTFCTAINISGGSYATTAPASAGAAIAFYPEDGIFSGTVSVRDGAVVNGTPLDFILSSSEYGTLNVYSSVDYDEEKVEGDITLVEEPPNGGIRSATNSPIRSAIGRTSDSDDGEE